MYGLLTAGLLLAPALVGAVDATTIWQGNTPSALITLELPAAEIDGETSLLGVRFDVLEMPSACGPAKVALNGEVLPAAGHFPLSHMPDFGDADADDSAARRHTENAPAAVVRWDINCVSWGGEDREQIMRLRVVSVDGTDLPSADAEETAVTTIRFRQTAPAHIVLVEGAASVKLFYDPFCAGAGAANSHIADHDSGASSPDFDAANLAAWQHNLAVLHHRLAVLRHDIDMSERYIRERFGTLALGAESSSSFFHHVVHKITGAAKSLYNSVLSFVDHDHEQRSEHINKQDSARADAGWLHPHPPPSGASAFLFRCPGASASSPPSFSAPPSAPAPVPASANDPSIGGAAEQEDSHDGNDDYDDDEDSATAATPDGLRGKTMHGIGETMASASSLLAGWEYDEDGMRVARFDASTHSSAVVLLAFAALVVAIAFAYFRHARRRRTQDHSSHHNGLPEEDVVEILMSRVRAAITRFHERRRARRELRAQHEDQEPGFFHRLYLFILSSHGDHEKLDERQGATLQRTALHGRVDGHVEADLPQPPPPPPPRTAQRAPSSSSSIERSIAEFRRAADVVDQIIAAEEGRAVIHVNDAQRLPGHAPVQPTRSPVATDPIMPPPASVPPYYAASPPYVPPPATGIYGGYHQRVAADVDSDFDDNESVPPAYSPDDYSYVNVETSLVADGFHYHNGSRP